VNLRKDHYRNANRSKIENRRIPVKNCFFSREKNTGDRFGSAENTAVRTLGPIRTENADLDRPSLAVVSCAAGTVGSSGD